MTDPREADLTPSSRWKGDPRLCHRQVSRIGVWRQLGRHPLPYEFAKPAPQSVVTDSPQAMDS